MRAWWVNRIMPASESSYRITRMKSTKPVLTGNFQFFSFNNREDETVRIRTTSTTFCLGRMRKKSSNTKKV